jgi:RHS repeat-associated protein
MKRQQEKMMKNVSLYWVGEIVQHIEYVPFGEVFIEERNNTWNTPYLFNAKELDEETGLYYYGARYYDARSSVWLSADPLQEKYPNVSSYVYCVQNPVKFVDPTGMDWYINDITGELYFNKNISDASTTYKDQVYTRIGNNEMFGNQKDIGERHYNYKSSLVIANYFGYNIEPVQQVKESKKTKISDYHSSATVETAVIEIVVNEKYSLVPIDNEHQVKDNTKTEILGNKFGVKEFLKAMAGAADIIIYTREYSNYLNSSDLKKSGEEEVSVPAYGSRTVYKTWQDYSRATGGKGSLLEYK